MSEAPLELPDGMLFHDREPFPSALVGTGTGETYHLSLLVECCPPLLLEALLEADTALDAFEL